MFGLIYKITNTVNGKIYIGQTVQTIQSRWRLHCLASSRCFRMKSAIKKYGKDCFTIEQIEACNSKEELNFRELYWINHYDSVKNGYNVKYSSSITEEIWKKIASKTRGQKRSQASKEKMSLAAKGRKPWNFGITTGKPSWNSGKKKPRILKPKKDVAVLQYDMNAVLIQKFNRISDAAKSVIDQSNSSCNRVVASNIRQNCLRNRGSVYGFKWKFEDHQHRDFFPDYKPQVKPVLKKIRASKNNQILEFKSLNEAARQLGFSAGNISRSCKKGYSCGGFKFEYL